jgi:hypothetical protein
MTTLADAWDDGYRFARGVDPLAGDNPYRQTTPETDTNDENDEEN